MGAPEVEGYLSDLAVERHVSAGTHNQAVIALVLLNSRGGGALVPRAAAHGSHRAGALTSSVMIAPVV